MVANVGTDLFRLRHRWAGAIVGGGGGLKCARRKNLTFGTGNISMNPLLVLMIVVMILLVYLKRHGGW
jgi:hypothetical protein